MNKTTIAKVLTAMIMGSLFVGNSAMAENSVMEQAQTTASETGSKIDGVMEKVDGFMGDSDVTANVKAALVGDSAIKSTDISVKTEEGVVTLSGSVPSQEQAEKVIALAKNVAGVKSVNDKLHVKDGTESSVREYIGDATTTGEIKTKLLADDIVPSRNVKVETTDGVVQLSGNVDNQAQSDRAESIAKATEGVKSVKNNLEVKQ